MFELLSVDGMRHVATAGPPSTGNLDWAVDGRDIFRAAPNWLRGRDERSPLRRRVPGPPVGEATVQDEKRRAGDAPCETGVPDVSSA
jgi:hypothetical protein